jgi:hypothetical protein
MNERIKELMKEAQVIYDYAPFYGDMDRDPKPLYKLDPEKFAELIVRECSQYIEDKFDFCGDEIIIAEKLLEHFGVES